MHCATNSKGRPQAKILLTIDTHLHIFYKEYKSTLLQMYSSSANGVKTVLDRRLESQINQNTQKLNNMKNNKKSGTHSVNLTYQITDIHSHPCAFEPVLQFHIRIFRSPS